MSVDRRGFLKVAIGATVGMAAGGGSSTARANESTVRIAGDATEAVGCLVDTTLCIGCRKCEEACNRSNELARPEQPFQSRDVLRSNRRPDAEAFTVINSYPGRPSQVQGDRRETFVKVQCMHCLDPACVSACIVGALEKTREGPVLYDAERCIGCRYCMVACPFEIPAYEYLEPLSPRVRKCTFCVDEVLGTSALPACAAACPVEAIVFGTRTELLELAHRRIADRPDRYHEDVYGEKEVGGTSWLYLTGRPSEEIGLLDLPEDAPPRLTESIQHGIFKYGAAPIAAYGGLAALMAWNVRRGKKGGESA